MKKASGYTCAALLAILIAVPTKSGAATRELCGIYRIDSPNIIKFNANEKKMVCGDSDAASWRKIPRFQAEHFIRAALQGRGYFYPEFENKGESVIVRPGAKTKVKSVSVDGSPPSDFRVDRRRGIRGAILTPSLLNSCEKWAQGQLKSDGYACPRVSSSARADTGDIVLHLEPGEQMKIFDVDEGELEGLRPGTLRRFDAFRLGDTYDYRKLTLTTRRIEEDGIFQSSHFRTECTPDGALLKQQNIVGPTRLFSIGFGANSEDYFVVKATWKMARLGKNGSSFMVTGWGTYRKQNITLQGRLYPLPFPSRWHLNPSLTNRNVNESRYRYTAIDVFVPPAVTWESNSAHFRAAFGPKLNFTHTYSGAARGMTHFLSASARFDVTSHDFEYNILDPVKGYTVSAGVDLNHDSMISSITAQQLTLKGQALWSIDGFDPPLFILAVRGQAGTTIVNDNSASFARLPPQFLYYLGGSQDVRGFSRKQLPAADRGALTSLYAGVELRIANILPLNIQPIIFADFAAMGQRSLRLDFPAYWSPGLGIRWPSIVGTLRLNAAHGYLINDKSALAGRPGGWQYYISLGEEF